jgi:hypothetical protein
MVDGYIAIQAESAPTKFKTLEVLDLAGCKDPKASNHREYFVKADASECVYVTSQGDAEAFAKRGYRVHSVPGGLKVAFPERSDFRIALTGLDGRVVLSRAVEGGEAFLPTSGLRPGVHALIIRQGADVRRIKVLLAGE